MARKYIQFLPTIRNIYSLMPYNIGIIGAARRHQGTGPFIARTFDQLGHRICGIVGTSLASIDNAAVSLSKQFGISTQGYTDIEELFNQQRLDIVVISSPPDTHLEYLAKSLNHGCHVFCEKPLWWPNSKAIPSDLNHYEQSIEQILSLAKKQNLYIHINTQWTYTIKDFIRLHPNAMASGRINQFSMQLSPQSNGVNMLVDAASHGLSMLYQLVGSGEIDDIKITHQLQDKRQHSFIHFDYNHAEGCVKTELAFIESHEVPKPASYQINNHSVNRIVVLPEYQIQLQSDQQTVDIQDPLNRSINDFLASIDAGLDSDYTALNLGARHLYQLIESYQ